MNQQERSLFADREFLAYLEKCLREGKRRRPPLTVEVTRRYVTFIRPGTSTSYEVSRQSYDRLATLANSGAYVVEILDSGFGIAWTMRRKATL